MLIKRVQVFEEFNMLASWAMYGDIMSPDSQDLQGC